MALWDFFCLFARPPRYSPSFGASSLCWLRDCPTPFWLILPTSPISLYHISNSHFTSEHIRILKKRGGSQNHAHNGTEITWVWPWGLGGRWLQEGLSILNQWLQWPVTAAASSKVHYEWLISNRKAEQQAECEQGPLLWPPSPLQRCKRDSVPELLASQSGKRCTFSAFARGKITYFSYVWVFRLQFRLKYINIHSWAG